MALISCRWCGQVYAAPRLAGGEEAVCARCGAGLGGRRVAAVAKTLAFSSAALLLYAPANVFPILRLSLYGATIQTTVWNGCVRLYEGGNQVLALIVFLASIVIPLLKLLGLFSLSVMSLFGSKRWRRGRTRLYRVIDAVGRWAMLDVFILAVLVSALRLERLAAAAPGEGALAFAGVVIFTLLAAQSFDPRVIWDEEAPQ